jgi:putative hydrolase of the HAD superfamily
MIKAITFDFWNTLYTAAAYAHPLRRRFLRSLLDKHQIDLDDEQLDTAEAVARDEWNRIWREDYRTPSAAEWVRMMLAELNVQLPATDFDALAAYYDRSLLEANPGPTLIAGARETIGRLAHTYRLGIISDSGLSTGRTLREFLIRDQIIDRFACLTFSDELGVSKPHPRAFLSTLDCLGARPDEAVHLGDLTRSDIAGARAAGMRAVRLAACYDDPDRSVAPDAVVRSYAEFEAWLARDKGLS